MNINKLNEYEFKKSHSIEKVNDMPDFKHVNGTQLSEKPSVYVWISKEANNDDVRVLYVGKAGYGVKRRLSQHKGGFKYSKTGKENKNKLIDEINSGREVFVYHRVSEDEIFLDSEIKVSRYSFEEEAFFLLLAPEWNRAGFPVIHSENIQDKNKLADILASDFIIFRDGEQDELYSYLNSISEKSTGTFSKLIKFVHDFFAKNNCSCKLVRGYTNQPKGCNAKPLIVYASKFKSNGDAKNFFARITLTDEPKIIFPIRLKNPDVDVKLIDSTKGSFSPIDTQKFISDPSHYVSRTI